MGQTPPRLSPRVVEEAIAQANAEIKDRGFTFSIAQTRTELNECAAVTTRAFMDYKMYDWMLEGNHPAERSRAIEFSCKIVQRICYSLGYVIVAKDQHNNIIGSVNFEHRQLSRWAPRRFFQYARLGVVLLGSILFGSTGFPAFIFRMQKTTVFLNRIAALEELEVHHTKTMDKLIGEFKPHLYIIQLATDPNRQSAGVGSSLLRMMAILADKVSLATYLETDTERLREFYEKNGFHTKVSYAIPDPCDLKPFEPNYGMVRLI